MSGAFTVIPRAREPARICERCVCVAGVHLCSASSAIEIRDIK